MPVVSTHPGTPMKVSPLMDAPIMPKATSGHGDLCSPRKKALLLPLFPVITDTM